MQVQVDMGFDQLLKIVRKLPSGQLKQLKAEMEKEAKSNKSVDLRRYYLTDLPRPKNNWKSLKTIEKRSTNGGQNSIG